TWIVLAIIVVAVAYTLIKRQKNLAALQTGEDMEKLKEAVRKVLPNESGYKVVFAHYERSESYGRRTTTYYYSYAIAFDATRMFVIPLKFEKGQILPQQPALLTSDNIGVADISETRKQDHLKEVFMLIRNKNGENPLQFYVTAQNLQSDRFHHFNILQQEECEAFARFAATLAQKVTAENGELQDKLAHNNLESSKKSSKTLGILSIAFCWFFFVGIIFGVIGLICAPKPKVTGKPVPGYVLSLIGTILSLLIGLGTFMAIMLS
ncbi:MAG: hypothetical protein K2F83_04210, partial [Oscillospiraceae bacterium]|nr:hypothetical protein [Oscillospiraceae bacterium]